MSSYELEEEDAKSTQAWAGGLFLLLATALVLWNLYQAMEMSNSESWSKTAGRVIASGTLPGTGPFSSITNYADVTYTYSVSERQFTGHNLRWGSNYRLSLASAREEAGRYPVGAEVTVYYDPDSPKMAVLEPGFNRHFVFDLVGGLLLIGLAFVAMNTAFAYAAKILMRHDSS